MIISNSNRYVFVHIRKCGGTSLTHFLHDSMNWNDIELGSTEFGESIQGAYLERFGLHKHSTALEIRNTIGQPLWDDYFTFTTIRHPLTRAVSLYTYIGEKLDRSGPRRRLFSVRRRRANDEFLTWPLAQAHSATSTFSEFIRHELFLTSQGAQPMHTSLCDDKGQLLVDVAVKLENLGEDLPEILSRTGAPISQLPKMNQSSHHDSMQSFYKSESDVEHIYDFYQRDFELFGYSVSDALNR